ncbi:MAG: lytic murein transglycosylase [Halofilum sp. (in: g-proteobacteria)]
MTVRYPLRWALCLALAGPSGAQALTDEGFASCLADLRERATDHGVSADALAAVEPIEQVLELDRDQPEFTTTLADYLGRRVTDARVEQGRALIEEHKTLLDALYREYGVPPRYLVAFWGLETDFGSYTGRTPILDAVATLACDQRRSDYYAEQVLAALRILDEGPLEPDDLKGSWAGAMGHVQFMPEVFVRYAVDHDGDGQRDLWGSVPDSLASAANFLRAVGWESGWRWGREVLLPPDFPYELAGYEPRPLTEWKRHGVRTAYGHELSDADVDTSLLVLAGHEGPAFLVYDNFHTILRWNRSEFYAVAVGHLADRLAGRAGLANPPPEDAPPLRRDQVMALQERLAERGFEPGPADGVSGPQTRQAIRRFQKSQDMIADGFASREVLSRLSLQVAEPE